MPFRGVRISWLMLARNMLLASAAVSAATCACTNNPEPLLLTPCPLTLTHVIVMLKYLTYSNDQIDNITAALLEAQDASAKGSYPLDALITICWQSA